MSRLSRTALMAIPPLVFVAFAAIAFVGLRRENPDELPSALVGRTAPGLARLVALRDDPVPTDADLTAPGVKLVNFWASWCPPCRRELPILRRLQAKAAREPFVVSPVSLDKSVATVRTYLDRLGLADLATFIDAEGVVASGPKSAT